MRYDYRPRGTCSSRIEFEIEDGILTDLKFTGGCDGNLQGIPKLAIGRPAAEVRDKLRGIKCGWKDTSCPDQLARALEKALSE